MCRFSVQFSSHSNLPRLCFFLQPMCSHTGKDSTVISLTVKFPVKRTLFYNSMLKSLIKKKRWAFLVFSGSFFFFFKLELRDLEVGVFALCTWLIPIIQLYLGDEVWVQLTGLVYHNLKVVPGSQRHFVDFLLLLHKVQQWLHFFTSKVQHWVQVINHTIYKHTRARF